VVFTSAAGGSDFAKSPREHRLRGPRFWRLFPDVYAQARDKPPDLLLRSLAAHRLTQPRGVLAGYSAACVLDADCALAALGPRPGCTPHLRRAVQQVGLVSALLQRGVAARPLPGTTLRGTLGLPRPQSRYATLSTPGEIR
jgi:hypothetical protein